MAVAERRRRVGPALLAALVAAAVAGCGGGGGNGDVAKRRAESEVAEKQKALDEARSDLTAKTTAFCTSTATYLTALDRYGDVLHSTAPTVGDVKNAGADLTDPRTDVVASAEAVTAAKDQVATAEKDLTEAQSALARLSGSPSVPAGSASASHSSPTVPAATVNRVKQADADFTAAQQGITDQTPLAQAAEQFNAAAVALEMSWLTLFAQAGCLTGEQQEKAEAAVRDYTTALQKSLADAGYYKGEVDGVYGPSTVDAVKALQQKKGLPVTGAMDKATTAALQAELAAKGSEAADQATASTAAVQQTLKLAGHWTGPVDGVWTPALTEALKSFQKDLGVAPTGQVDAATIAAAERALAQSGSPQASATPSGG
ncbi:peptidoglycan-binding domain-containing protein [Krasilnikovia sp. MM14-A1259]|uniref:peptidoglycan-binding domain-containing protein n=1 Tax=Krasilnikovia sp. MM14-A1259 TaxID=3373539 RepID=UPI00382F6E77